MKLALLSLAAAFGLAANADAAVNLKIKNFSGRQVWLQWTGMPATGLTGTTNGITIQPSDYNSNAAGYDISTFASTVANEYEITNFSMNGGRMWFTYGPAAWTFHNTGYTPALATFNDQNFTVRYDKIEATIIGSTADTVNMTALDGFSIPFSVEGYLSTNRAATTQTLRGDLGRRVYSPLAAIAATPSAPAPNTPPLASPSLAQIAGNSPYLVINSSSLGLTQAPGYTGYQYSPIGQTGSFVRVIGNDNLVAPYVTAGGVTDPVSVANGGPPANYVWKVYENYLKLMDGRATTPYAGTTTIAAPYNGLKSPTSALNTASTYSMTATFDATEPRTVTYSGATIAFTGFVTLKGTVTIPSGTYQGTYTTEIKIPYGGLSTYYNVASGTYVHSFLLDPSGVVGSNPNYLYKFYLSGTADPGYTATDPYSGGPQNNVITQIAGDLLAGMNLGTAGSTATLTQALTINGNAYPIGTTIGSMPSHDWFSLGQALAQQKGQGSVYDYYFGYLQTSTDYYNRYAETLYPLTDAYAFAYSDRVQGGTVVVSWDATKPATALDTIVITILPDEVGPIKPNGGGGRVEAVEYHNESLNDYFATWVPSEIAKLDSGAIKGWTRTGRWFNAFTAPQAGTTPVCRLYLPPAQGDSHFFGRDPAECANAAASNPSIVLEDPAFMHLYLPVNGACPTDSTPVYRLFSNRADTNHRLVTDTGTRTQMQVRGWVAEGDGPERVTMCSPV